MRKGFFIDTTLCTACRGCQVACKQWHNLPAEETKNRGTYENPGDLSFNTYKLVRMREEEIGGKLKWLFFPEQCRHCTEPPCRDAAGDESAIFRDIPTGTVVFTAKTKGLNTDEIIEACPYNVPRKGPDGTLAKCDMCLDRVLNGLEPACVATCPTGAMSFGDLQDMAGLAKQRLGIVKKTNPDAALLDVGIVSVIYLTAYDPGKYHKHAVASNRTLDITRQVALKRMFRPITEIASRLV